MMTAGPIETADADLLETEIIRGRVGAAAVATGPTEHGCSQHGSTTGESARAGRRGVVIAVRSFAATTLLIVGMLGAGVVGYHGGKAGYRVQSHGSDPGPMPISLNEPTEPKKRACETLAGAYRSLPEQLRAAPPGQSPILAPTPGLKLAGAASDLAELLRLDLGAEYAFRPWPAWLQTMDNYVAALRAVAFVAGRPDAPEPVRAGIAELYQQALAPTLALCYVAR